MCECEVVCENQCEQVWVMGKESKEAVPSVVAGGVGGGGCVVGADPLQCVQWICKFWHYIVRVGVPLAAATTTPAALPPGALAVGSGIRCIGVLRFVTIQLMLDKLVQIRWWLLAFECGGQVSMAVIGRVSAGVPKLGPQCHRVVGPVFLHVQKEGQTVGDVPQCLFWAISDDVLQNVNEGLCLIKVAVLSQLGGVSEGFDECRHLELIDTSILVTDQCGPGCMVLVEIGGAVSDGGRCGSGW